MLEGELRTLVFESKVLRGNVLGDPWVRELPVYVPPGGAQDTPLLLVLAGFGGTGAGALAGTPWEPSLPERYERLLRAGRARPATFVFPDAFTRYGGSQYVDSPATGRYETWLVEEVVPFVEHELGAGGRRSRRGVIGRSSGGFGALHLGLRHPRRFAALASHSGDMAFDLCYRPDLPRLVAALDRYGGLAEFLRAFEAAPRKTPALFGAMGVLALAAAYSPDPREPLSVALPCDPRTGRLHEDVWRRWLEHDPVEVARRRGEVLADFALLYVDAGRDDEYHLHLGARQLVDVLREKGCTVHHEEYDDGHRGTSYRYDASLPLLTAALG